MGSGFGTDFQELRPERAHLIGERAYLLFSGCWCWWSRMCGRIGGGLWEESKRGSAPPSRWRGEGHTDARVSVCVPRVRLPVSVYRLFISIFIFELVLGRVPA